MKEHRIKVEIEDVSAVMGALPMELQRPGSGITFDDGELIVLDEEAADKVREVADKLPDARRKYLKRYASSVRRHHEDNGKVKVDGHAYSTDDRTKLRMVVALQSNKSLNWKTHGGFVKLSSDNLREVLTSISNFVEGCFSVEASLHERITKGHVTTEDIDGAAWPR